MPGITGKFGLGVQNVTCQRLIEFCQENALVIPNTLFQQHKRRLYTWTSPDSQYRNQSDYILCSQRWRSSVQSAETILGADCGSDHLLPLLNSDSYFSSVQFSSVQSLSHVPLFATPWITACQASLSITNSHPTTNSSEECSWSDYALLGKLI